MEPTGGEFEPNEEVDELRWLPPARGGGAPHLPRDPELAQRGVE